MLPTGRGHAGDPSPAGFPVDLVGCEYRAFTTDPLWCPRARHDDAAEACANRAAHVLLHRDLEERLPASGRRSGRIDLARAAFPAELGDAEPLASPSGQSGESREHPGRATRESLVGPGLVLPDEVGHQPSPAHRAVV